MNKKYISILCIMVCIICMICSAYASETILKIDDVLCAPGEVVNVPISISGNSGIAGAVIKISYDNELELIAINQGDAFSSLTYTPPAKLTSNPITLLWDGMEADESNGIIAILQFRTPDIIGEYEIFASYDVGGIYDGNLEDINVAIDDGSITTKTKNSISATMTENIDIRLIASDEIDGMVYVALYGVDNQLLSIRIHPAEKTIISGFSDISLGKYIKVFWWDAQTMEPYCKPECIELN